MLPTDDDYAAMTEAMPAGTPASVIELAAAIYANLPAGAERAQLARRITDGLREAFGGNNLYIAKPHDDARAQRDAVIWLQFDGHNHAALARAHNLTERQIYAIVETMRGRDLVRRQSKLF